MRDLVFTPSPVLQPFVMHYWTCRHDEDVCEVMFPSGSVELCIDISKNSTTRHRGNRSMKVPTLEILGHWNIPTKASLEKGNMCLITRFHPYASTLFFPNSASEFTNVSTDLGDILCAESKMFYNQLMEQHSITEKIKILESFLVKQLNRNKKIPVTLNLVRSIAQDIQQSARPFSMRQLSDHYGYSERYIQKIFLQWVGITPHNFSSIMRFNRSLELVRSGKSSLTNVAYDCGYYDQAHFIREFKSYTGITPSRA